MPSAPQRLAVLHNRPVNYNPDGPHDPAHGWRIDDYCEKLPPEPPGEPVEGGSFEVAQRLLRQYRVADPKLVDAFYDHDAPLEGRDMLLKMKFLGLHVWGGCRIGTITDEERAEDGRRWRVWGWPYQTLEGHIEQGQMSWEVWKDLDSGQVEFRVHSYSRVVGSRNPFVVLGVRLFGQYNRRRYLTHACRRMAELTAAGLRGEHPAGARTGG